MSKNERCELCKFWGPHPYGKIYGDCHRYPPIVGEYEHPGFPEIQKDEWCGEFAAKEEDQNDD